MGKRFSEYVSPGHPDKCADYISEYILDRYIEQDPNVRYAVEVMIKGDMVILAGEVTSTAYFDDCQMKEFVKQALYDIGYTKEYHEAWGGHVIDPENLWINYSITCQSPEISQGVDNDGWGDQGIFFGYADPDGGLYMMPKSHALAKNLCHMLYTQAKEKGVGGIDIKTEIILDDNGWFEKIIAAVPCRDDQEYEAILNSIKKWYEDKRQAYVPFEPEIILNGTGSYVWHGPGADCGITGRKLAVDFYGGEFQVGGGSPWTKDGSKSDLSLNLLARSRAKRFAIRYKCPVKVAIACCIGRKEIDICAKTDKGEDIMCTTVKYTPSMAKTEFGLDKPIYASMCKFGLFGEYQDDKNWE